MKHTGLEYRSPTPFTPKQRVALAVIPFSVAAVMRMIFATQRVSYRGLEHLERATATHGRVIIALWHECLGMGIRHFRRTGFHTLTSYSYDGEIAARVAGAFGIPALRGSSSRGGLRALVQLEKALRMGVTVGFTVDGPRGPRRVVKPGIAMLSARTGVPVVPMGFAADAAWRLRSWDRFIVPKPFAQLHVAAAPPVPAEGHGSIEAQRAAIESALAAIQAEADAALEHFESTEN